MVTTGPVVSTRFGRIQGTTDAGVCAFLGVPYAAPPFGPGRLLAPRSPDTWTGIRVTDEFGPTPPKSEYPLPARALFPEPVVDGDDCLNLNVWTPTGATGLPVLVWIYGGSFQMGSNAVPEYDGSAFARDGVVTVVPNYRLGVEGFGELDDAPSNRALLDVIGALSWVRDNIVEFGGDPERVTIGGESAGAAIVAALLATPDAAGLFSAAAMQSGPYDVFLSEQQGAQVAGALADLLGVEPTRAAFADLDPARLVEVGDALVASIPADPVRWGELVISGRPLAPVIDGHLLAGGPIERADLAADVPVLLGTNRDEYRLFLPLAVSPGSVDEADLRTRAEQYGLTEDGVRAYQQNATPGSSQWDVLASIIGDQRYLLPAIRYAQARYEAGGRTWMWRFDGVDRDDNNGLGSTHATDVPFIFATADNPALTSRIGPSPSSAAVRTVHSAWVRFISDHEPGWEQYEPDHRATALLGETTTIMHDPGANTRQAWER